MGSAMAIKRSGKKVTIASVNGPAGLNCFTGKIQPKGKIRGWTLDVAPEPFRSTRKFIKSGGQLKERWSQGTTVWKRVTRATAADYRQDLTGSLKTCRDVAP